MLAPNKRGVIDGYHTKNLNKTAFLLLNGAHYRDCSVDRSGISTFILDDVHISQRNRFWDDNIKVELWKFIRIRKFLKEQVHAKQRETS